MRRRAKRKTGLLLFAAAVMIALPASLWAAGRQISVQEAEQEEAVPSERIDTDHVRMAESLAALPLQEAVQGTLNRTEYAYGCLSESGKRLYREILDAITGFLEDAELSTRDSSAVGDVMECVMADHPEIFYVDGYNCTTHTLGDEVVKVTFTARYTLDKSQVEERKALIAACVTEILNGMGDPAGDYEKLKYLYEYLIENTDYDLNAPENQTICSVFLYNRSVCQGYAKAFQLLCMEAGIPSVLVTGTVPSGEGHAWNLVYADGDWYYVDPTWGDARYRMSDPDPAWKSGKLPEVNYDYFLVTTRMITRTHRITSLFTLPECTSMTDNYYVRRDAYFTEADGEKIARLFQNAYEQGEEMVTLKCADGEVYEQLRRKLLDDQEIFRYLKGNHTSVAYIDSRDQLSLGFWL